MLIKSMKQLEAVKKECDKMATSRAELSGLISGIPVPGPDVVTDVGILLQVLPSINKKFGLSEEQIEELDPQIKMIILNVIERSGSIIIGKVLTKELILAILKRVGIRITIKQVAKYLPFIGTAASMVIGFSAMKWVLSTHIKDCYKIVKECLEKNPS